VLVAAHAACFWPVLRVYVKRLNVRTDDPSAIDALI
jgi:hypothetical protein